jgi:hypothetical protein
MLTSLDQGIDVCLTVTLLDGLVLARSAFHHSMNYRSVVLFGTAIRVDNVVDKLAALKAFTNHVVPARWDDVRPPSRPELAGTLVLALPIIEASVKLRNWPAPGCRRRLCSPSLGRRNSPRADRRHQLLSTRRCSPALALPDYVVTYRWPEKVAAASTVLLQYYKFLMQTCPRK